MKQLAKELRETPADFQAAQSGLKRQNLYGEDTIGVKAQAAADSLGDTLERRKSAGLSTIPGIPDALVPDTKMYAVRPKGTRMVQPKVPASAKGYRPEYDALNDLVVSAYGDTPAAQMPPEMVMSEYARRFLPTDSELRAAITNYSSLKAQEMFPDAPTPEDAQKAYDVLYSDRTGRNKQQLADVEEFLSLPENAAYRETTPTPSEFMQRMAEAERVIKGPFTTYISKNVGAEGDPTVKLARQGITTRKPEELQQMANFASSSDLARMRLEGGFPIEGAYGEEYAQKSAEFEKLGAEIEALEQVRRPLFEQAQAEGVDPASIPGYAETTNPLRQKLRQKEQLAGDIENIKLARAVEDLGDYAVAPRTKEQFLRNIPFAEQQFFPSVIKAGENEKLYTGRRSLLKDMGFDTLGEDLVEDILTGKAGDTSKLTIENYMREKGLSRIEAEKAAKLQQQQYRTNLQNTLLDRLKSDQNVKTFGNAAIITLDSNTPKDVAMRDMSVDTLVLDHCVGQCGTAPQGRKNVLTGQQQYYEPVIDPITGERSARASGNTSYVRDLERGHQLVSVRDVKTGLPAATLELVPSGEGGNTFRIGYASGAKNGSIDPAYVPALRDYLNQRSADIYSPGSNLADNAGIFDSTSPNEFRKAAREAGLTNDQVKATDWGDLPRFVTVDDIKAAAKGAGAPPPPAPAPAVQEAPAVTLSQQDYEVMRADFDTAWENARESALENSALDRPAAVEGGLNRIIINTFSQHLNDPIAFTAEGVYQLRRVERDLQNSIESAYAQRNDTDNEIANALQDFLIDVRGIRSSIERRLQANEAGQLEQVPAVQEAAPAPQGRPIPDLSADDLLAGYGEQMTREQRDWLGSFVRNWESNVDDSPAGGELADRMSRMYQQWRQENTLLPDPTDNLFDDVGDWEPDPTAVANNPNIPLNVLQEIQIRFRDPEVEVADLSMIRDSARARAPRTLFANLTQLESDNVANMITEEIERRIAGQDYDLLAEADMTPPPAIQRLAADAQNMDVQDLVESMNPDWVNAANNLAQMYFDRDIVNYDTLPFVLNRVRDYSGGPFTDQMILTRELAARRLERMLASSESDAATIAETLNDAFYMDMAPQEAMEQIDRSINSLERNGELVWEEIVGPMAEDAPWNRNLQRHLIGYLQSLADQYAARREEGYAKGGMVEKKHMAKKDGMPLLLTRKSPELTELAYQYGGMV
jgi:hypothetical protein